MAQCYRGTFGAPGDETKPVPHVLTVTSMVKTQRRSCGGVGPALLEAMVDLSDRWLQLTRLQLYVWDGNDAAIRLYERFGFEVEGRLRRFVVVDGAYRDALIMARLSDPIQPAPSA